MATNVGLDSQLGLKKESTYATPVTVDRFVPFLTEAVVSTIPLHVSEGIVAGRLTPDEDQAKQGVEEVGGPIEMEVYAQSQALLWELALGGKSTSGAGPYTHTLTPAGALPSATFQGARPGTAGTNHPFTWAGVKVNQLTMSGSVGEIGKLKLDVIGGVSETTGTALASASYTAGSMTPMVFREAGATVDGAAVEADSFEFTINNNLERRTPAGASITREPLRAGKLIVSGKVTVEFEDLTEYNKYQAGTALDVVLSFSDGTNSVTATIHTKLTGAPVAVAGPGRLTHDLTWSHALGDGTDSDAITVRVVNSDATA